MLNQPKALLTGADTVMCHNEIDTDSLEMVV